MSEQQKRFYGGKLTEQDLSSRESSVRMAMDKKATDLVPATLKFSDEHLSVVDKTGKTLLELESTEIKRAKFQQGGIFLSTGQGNKLIILDDGKRSNEDFGFEWQLWPKIFKHAGIKTSGMGRPVLLATILVFAFITLFFAPYISLGLLAVFLLYFFKG